MSNNNLTLQYELYCKYCKQLHITPVQEQDFHIELYHYLKALIHSCWGSYNYNKERYNVYHK